MTRQMGAYHVFFNEFNPKIDTAAYLPLTSGKLQAFAMTSDNVRKHYTFMPYLFHIDSLDNVLAHYEDPGVAAFSARMWNEQLCLRTAQEVKRRWPSSLIVFGGTQVPHNATTWMEQHKFIDVAVRGEGEQPFKSILERFVSAREFDGISNVTWRNPRNGRLELNPDSIISDKDLDIYPSPYLEGLFDDTIKSHTTMRFQAIIETVRGCPFLCTFCYWGKGGLSRKFRSFSLARVAAELEWLGRNRIGFVYNADSNFGMQQRDEEVAEMMVATKLKYGYPEKVVNLYGKNTDERIYRIARMLHQHGMHKGLGLSRQSLDEEALTNTRRRNIKLSVYQSLQERFEAERIPVFTELILGLPGETYKSFAAGLNELMEISLNCQLIIVLCEVYPNTEMANSDYLKRHGIITARNVNYGVHSVVQDKRWVTEYIDYIVGTRTMPTPDWIKSGKLAWTTMTLTSFRLGYYLLRYMHDRFGIRYIDFIEFITDQRMTNGTGAIWREELAHYNTFMNQIIEGRGRAVLLPEYGEIYWAIEEASYLRIAAHTDQFYLEMEELMSQFLHGKGIVVDREELHEAICYQWMRVAAPVVMTDNERVFEFNFPEYFESTPGAEPVALVRKPQKLVITERAIAQSKLSFARERLLWGRRGGTFDRAVRWEPVEEPCALSRL